MIWTMKPTAKKLEDVETKVGNVGSTDLQSQVTTLNNKVGNVGSTDLQSQVNTLNSNFVISYGELATGITYQKYGNIVTIYFNGNTVSNATGWTNLLTLPANLGRSRYSVHAKTMSDHDIRVSNDGVAYRGSAGEVYGVIVYIAS